uniref:UBIQUITIN_CONJUGAT_2 domain-containing protein n=1 Tax=Caenorhabditis tropicalis TaxID=1561998 RepID=A0A1I7TVU9_9PELO
MEETEGTASSGYLESSPERTLLIPENILVEQALAAEFVEVCRNPIDGIFVSPSVNNKFVWFGVIFIRKGIFGGGIFRFRIQIPSSFPNSTDLPRVIFHQSIFHPLISQKELTLARSFPDGWKPEKHSLRRVLIVIQRSFYSFDVDNDSEASILYKEHREKFREIAKECVESSRSMVYDEVEEDCNGIRLLPWDALIHRTARDKMIQIGKGLKAHGTAADFRRDVFSKMGLQVSEIVGRSYPQSYSWFDPEEMTVVTRYEEPKEEPKMTSARIDREKHGIEPLDLSVIGDLTGKSD